MLTGDNERTANAIAKEAGVDEVVAGADVAIDAADVVLVKSNLLDVPKAIRLSRATIRNIHENLFWAFIYNVIGIPLAAGCCYKLFGWSLNATFAALAMSLSSFCVVTNALRLNFANISSSHRDKKLRKHISGTILQTATKTETDAAPITISDEFKTVATPNNNQQINNSEDTPMTKTFTVEGMMCSHCEAAVKKTLETIPGVDSAKANHKTNSVEVVFTKKVPLDLLKEALSKEDYILKD